MGIDIEYTCDQCQKTIDHSFVEIVTTEFKPRGYKTLEYIQNKRRIFHNVSCLMDYLNTKQ